MKPELLQLFKLHGISDVDAIMNLLEAAEGNEDRIHQALAWLELAEDRFFGKVLTRCHVEMPMIQEIFRNAPRVTVKNTMDLQQYLGRNGLPPLPGNVGNDVLIEIFAIAKIAAEIKARLPEQDIPNSRTFL